MSYQLKVYEKIEAWIRACFSIFAKDVKQVLANRFPAIAEQDALKQHIPTPELYDHFVHTQNFDELRRALANIVRYIYNLGTERAIEAFLFRITKSTEEGPPYHLQIFPEDGFLLGDQNSRPNINGQLGLLGHAVPLARGTLGNFNGLIVTLYDAKLETGVKSYLDIVLPPYVSYTIQIERKTT